MFEFKSISSDDMDFIVEEPDDTFLSKASKNYEIIVNDASNGAEYQELGYSNIERTIKGSLMDTTKLDSIFSWLNGSGILKYKGRQTNAYFFNNIDPKRTSLIKIIELSFIREYYWTKTNDDFIIVTSLVKNEGNIVSQPIIRLEKGTASETELSIHGIRFKYTFPSEENYVEIDTKFFTVIYENLSRNRSIEIGYEYPNLEPGDNEIIIYSGDPIIKIKRKDYWL